MTTINRKVSAILAGVFLGGTLLTPIAVQASEQGRKNTTLGLGAVTGYLFTRKGSKVPAFVGLAATGYAYKRYDDSVKARHQRERARAARISRAARSARAVRSQRAAHAINVAHAQNAARASYLRNHPTKRG